MSRSVYADQVAQLEVQLGTALTESNKLKDALEASKKETNIALGRLATATKERDDARKSVSDLKVLLQSAEVGKARVEGQLDRVNDVEARAATPRVTIPYEAPQRFTDTTYGYAAERTGDKHWTSL